MVNYDKKDDRFDCIFTVTCSSQVPDTVMRSKAKSTDQCDAVLCWLRCQRRSLQWTLLTNFIIQQSRNFIGVCVPLCLTNCLFLVPDSQPTATELFQSPLYTDLEQSSTAYHVCSVTFCLLVSLEDILL